MTVQQDFNDVPEIVPPGYQVNKGFYDKVRAAKPRYKQVDRQVVPPYNGRGFLVNAGHTIRVIGEEGAQIADMAFWNAHDSKETFRVGPTWLMDGYFIRVYSRLWSGVPWFRPLTTCVEDTVINTSPEDENYHHHFIGHHCTPELVEMRTGRAGMNCCHLNLLQGIEPFGLKEENILDNINVHQKVRVGPKTGRLQRMRSDSKPGDYIEFYAELDLLVSVSLCPQGDNNTIMGVPDETTVKPLAVEVYDTGIAPQEPPTWTDWRPAWKGQWEPPQS